jgi:hypothetical protein
MMVTSPHSATDTPAGGLAAAPAAAAAGFRTPGPDAGVEVAAALHDDRAFGRPHDVLLQDNLAFVPGKDGTMTIVDVGDPGAARVLSTLDEGLIEAETVLPMGPICLLGTHELISLDVRDPRRPQIAARIGDPRIHAINGFALWGHYLFSANKGGHVVVFDVRDPARPVLHDALDLNARAGQQRPHDVAVYGNRIVVVDGCGFLSSHVTVYRFADEGAETPLPAAEWEVEGQIRDDPQLIGCNRVEIAGHYAFVGCNRPHTLGVIDLSDPKHLTQVVNVPTADGHPDGLTIAGRVLFVGAGQTVEAIDISEPRRPRSIAWWRPLDVFSKGRDNAHDLVYRDGFVYVTAQNDNTFGILRVTNPGVLRLAA